MKTNKIDKIWWGIALVALLVGIWLIIANPKSASQSDVAVINGVETRTFSDTELDFEMRVPSTWIGNVGTSRGASEKANWVSFNWGTSEDIFLSRVMAYPISEWVRLDKSTPDAGVPNNQELGRSATTVFALVRGTDPGDLNATDLQKFNELASEPNFQVLITSFKTT